VLLLALLQVGAIAQAPADARVEKETPKLNRARGLNILKQIREIVDIKYYDEAFNGYDFEAKFKAAEERIETLERNADIYRTIADFVLGLNDSHTIFYPPNLRYRVEYGFSMSVIGDRCFVTEVKPGSDAAAMGLKAGDQILHFNGQTPTRNNLWLIHYIIYALEPQEDIKLKVRDADRKDREVSFKSKFISPEERKKERKKRKNDEQAKPYTCVAIGSDIIACKLRTFEVEKSVIDKMMKEVMPRNKLILDLRGNAGGYVDTVIHLTGSFFDQDVTIGTEKLRRKTKERIAKGRRDNAYKGDLMVLIDSETGSASEVFSRVIQIEKRGRVAGDVSMGGVMTSLRYGIATETRAPSLTGGSTPYYLSKLSISIADLIMADGNRLEGRGVVPDVRMTPGQVAIYKRTDPLLSYAAELMGSPITDEEAGKFYFLVPKPEEAADKFDDEITGK
jgi:C-terminal processing protease CtpA/Prc